MRLVKIFHIEKKMSYRICWILCPKLHKTPRLWTRYFLCVSQYDRSEKSATVFGYWMHQSLCTFGTSFWRFFFNVPHIVLWYNWRFFFPSFSPTYIPTVLSSLCLFPSPWLAPISRPFLSNGHSRCRRLSYSRSRAVWGASSKPICNTRWGA